jgi:hypothetical protein
MPSVLDKSTHPQCQQITFRDVLRYMHGPTSNKITAAIYPQNKFQEKKNLRIC